MKPNRHAAGETAPSPESRARAARPDPLPAAAAPVPPAAPALVPPGAAATPEPDWAGAAEFLESYPPAQLAPRRDGWTARRQRLFLTILAETGSISEACIGAGVSSRSAYRLRARPDAPQFAAAWDQALKLAAVRLTALAFERATKGTVREVFRNGELHTSTREPSDRLLAFLLGQLLPAGRPGERWAGFEAMTDAARATFPAALEGLRDHAVEMVPILSRDFFSEPPGDEREDC